MGERIELHIFGAKKGESIAVRLPGNRWGVVDTYTPNLARPESNPTLRFLQARGVGRLSFLCLTHPHDDHFRGMSHLMKAFRPDNVWLFGAKAPRDLYAQVAAALKLSSESNHTGQEESESAGDLVRFLDQVRDELKEPSRNPPLRVKRLQSGLTLLDESSTIPQLRLISLGASGGRAMIYEEALKKCFDPITGSLAERAPHVNHNLISGGIVIEFGRARIVLGGDIEREAWEETLRENLPGLEGSHLVKASHHGSTTGYCDGLWERFSPGRSAVAVIAPFSSQGLPSAEGLAHIASHASSTFTPSVKAAHLATDWSSAAIDTFFKGVSLDALVNLRSIFPKAWPSSERLEGICSFYVAEDGAVTSEMSGEAGVLSA